MPIHPIMHFYSLFPLPPPPPIQIYMCAYSTQVGFLPPSLVPGSQWSWRVQSSRGLNRVQRSKSFSAPVPLQLCVVGEEVGEREEDLEQTGELIVG